MNKKHLLRNILIAAAVLLIAGITGFGVYTSDYYRAGERARNILESDSDLSPEGNWLYLNSESDRNGLIFYPGAKVEYTAYLPLLELLKEQGVDCFLVEMPFNLAIFGSDRAEDVIEAHPEIENWYIAGHSMGGAFASSFASKHPDEIAGVMLLGAYLYGDYPAEDSVTVYGSEDRVLNLEKITYEDNIHVIDGANHAGFGNYGEQDGDGKASISEEEQQSVTAEIMLDFMEKR